VLVAMISGAIASDSTPPSVFTVEVDHEDPFGLETKISFLSLVESYCRSNYRFSLLDGLFDQRQIERQPTAWINQPAPQSVPVQHFGRGLWREAGSTGQQFR